MTNFLYGCIVGCAVTIIAGLPVVHGYLTRRFADLKQHVSDEIKKKLG